jgi:large subunit ribosomal protein L17
MRHAKKGKQLSRTASHREALLRNMAISLFRHGRIHTTTAKAKELRPFAERLITLAKKGDLHARRIAGRKIHDRDVLFTLFDSIGPRFAERAGGVYAGAQDRASAGRWSGDGVDRAGRSGLTPSRGRARWFAGR